MSNSLATQKIVEIWLELKHEILAYVTVMKMYALPHRFEMSEKKMPIISDWINKLYEIHMSDSCCIVSSCIENKQATITFKNADDSSKYFIERKKPDIKKYK